MVDTKDWIKIRCEICGNTGADINDWSGIRCPLHGNPICGDCCHKCEYRVPCHIGMTKCGYKSPMKRQKEAHDAAEARFRDENQKISAVIEAKRKEKAREYAIKMAKARKREKQRKAATAR